MPFTDLDKDIRDFRAQAARFAGIRRDAIQTIATIVPSLLHEAPIQDLDELLERAAGVVTGYRAVTHALRDYDAAGGLTEPSVCLANVQLTAQFALNAWSRLVTMWEHPGDARVRSEILAECRA